MHPFTLRPYLSEDRERLYEICLRTGDAGRDASARCTHPHLLGDYFAVPYVEFDPALAVILADDEGACGYILGTANTENFCAWLNAIWLPRLRPKYQRITPVAHATDAWLLDHIRHDSTVPELAREYPAHLHIDLLPRAQRRGWGRTMFLRWIELAAARGASGVHLGVARANTGAICFYEQMGMHRVAAAGDAWAYGMHLRASH